MFEFVCQPIDAIILIVAFYWFCFPMEFYEHRIYTICTVDDVSLW